MSFDDTQILSDLPNAEAARRFLERFEERNAKDFKKLAANRSLLSDILAIVSFSDYLSATLLENPQYLAWLDKRRRDSGVRSKEELLESLAQFRLTNSTFESSVLYEKFRRRELLRIFLRDIRRLATIAEITEEISNLADAILESALREACTEVDNRFGRPQEEDVKGKARAATFCIVALGKLGSRELNYSSDIDLLFIYSGDGGTRGGTKESVTNREYFVKLAELIIKLVGKNTTGPSAYRVDMRLRPHGSLGALTMSLADTCSYYKREARPWERQVLIRSRAAAGEPHLFTKFFAQVETLVFADSATPADALSNIREAKLKIDARNATSTAQDVKVGRGGIREIEFLAQGLQLAYGGRDTWLRASHTLISLSRLAEHNHISSQELSELAAAYDFLRRTEHIIQMENGLQTHLLPNSPAKLVLLSERMRFAGYEHFVILLGLHRENVRKIFDRVTRDESSEDRKQDSQPVKNDFKLLRNPDKSVENIFKSSKNSNKARENVLEPSDSSPKSSKKTIESLFSFFENLKDARNFSEELSILRKGKTESLFKVREDDLARQISIFESKALQTELAEAFVKAALDISNRHNHLRTDASVLALGKLGSRTFDYGSDLDLVIVYDGEAKATAEAHSRVAETFINVLSSMTRDGNLYRVDLRLRPHGSKGMICLPGEAFLGYLKEEAAIWEFLAFVKLRGLGDEESYAREIEVAARDIIHRKVLELDADELKSETKRIRLALEESKSSPRRQSEIDIKYGSGGMLDIYFAVRFLQLRDDVRDDDENRSTAQTLRKLCDNDSLSADHFEGFLEAYNFLSSLDHALRLLMGRTRILPTGNPTALKKIAKRLNLNSVSDLNEQLTLHRLKVREIFEEVLN